MSTANHPAYKEELERYRYTLDYVKKSLERAKEKRKKVGNELDSVQNICQVIVVQLYKYICM